MLRFILRRLVSTALLLVGVVVTTFALARLLPGRGPTLRGWPPCATVWGWTRQSGRRL